MTGRRQQGEKVYEIKVEGHLDELWCEWFDGLLERVRDLGLTLLSVNRMEPG